MACFHRLLFTVLCCNAVLEVCCITVEEFYSFGESSGDSLLTRVLDGSSGPITLQTEFPFSNQSYRNVYVNTNGIISFTAQVLVYTPLSFPISEDNSLYSIPLIAPYWADTDIRPSNSGNVSYRETSDPALIARARSDIMRDPLLFPEVDFSTFLPTSILIATWDHIGYHDRHFDKTNTFQCVLVTDGRLSFVIFLYAEGLIQWTTGDDSEGTNGLGGTPAHVGFNAGSGREYVSVEGSLTPDIVNIDDRIGNTGVKGVWVFRVDNEDIHVTNCSSLDDTIDLVLLSNRGHMLGGTSVTVTGPCYNESLEYTCTFGTGIFVSRVRGVFLDERRLLCVTPMLTEIGNVGFRLQIRGKEGTEVTVPQRQQDPIPFYSLSFLTAHQVNLGRDNLLFTGGESLSPTWLRDAVFPVQDPDNYTVDVWLYRLSQSQRVWIRTACLASNIANSGRATVTFPHLEHSATDPRFSAVAIQVALNTSQAEPAELPTAAGLWTTVAFATDMPPTRDECNEWAGDTSRRMAEQEAIYSSTPTCPCTMQQAEAPNSGFTKQNMRSPMQLYFNPGATTCFYQSMVNINIGPARQCCYDELGRLTIGPTAGGHSDVSSVYSQIIPPSIAMTIHLQQDITPFIQCCKSTEPSCTNFFSFRPSAESECQYNPPPPACVYGDPHVVTLDGHKYTFNGKGEFTLIETEDEAFTLQGRMVMVTDDNEQPVQATVFSAIVAKENDSDTVQFQVDQQGVDLLINGERLIFDDLQQLTLNGVTVINLGNNTYAALFASGAYVQVQEELGFLSVLIVSLPDSFQNLTRGLMGSFNGDASDDLLPKGGSTPLPLNSSLQMIHEEFGLTWIVDSAESSLFSYRTDENWMDFFAPDFSAVFEPSFANPELESQAYSLCNGDQFCLFDIAATGRIDVGMSTQIGGQALEEIIEISAPTICEPPCLNGTCVGNNTCNCQAGYQGSRCEEAILTDECESNICNNGGTCRRLAEDYVCLCSQYYIGLTCTELLPLEIQCSSTLLGEVLTVDCSANKPLATTTCSLDGNPYVPCTLPLEVHLAPLGVGNYRLDVLATDTFNLTHEHFVTFSVEPLKLKCKRQVSEDHVVVIGCTTSNQPVTILCSFEQQPQAECTFPVHINLTRSIPGVYSMEITATDVFNLTDKNIISYTKPYLQIRFINSSPRVSGSTVVADFTINRRTVSVECFINGQGSKKECSSGFVRYDSVSPGTYTLRIVARAANGEREIERRKIHIGNDTSFCVVHLINDGVVVSGDDVSIQFLGSRSVHSYLCKLDDGNLYACRSPVRMYNLERGNYRFQVLPQGCGKNRRKLSVKFTVE